MKYSINKTADLSGIRLHYADELNGAGLEFRLDFIDVVTQKGWQVDRVYEMCSGPAFIGFSLLAKGLCKSLCLADINPKAVEACRRTIADNGLEDRVSVYLSDGLTDIPAHEQWDLVVGSPPFFSQSGSRDDRIKKAIKFSGSDLLWLDPDWQMHKDFYHNVGQHLRPGAPILMLESRWGKGEEDFKSFIKEGNLEFVETLPCRRQNPRLYYIHARQPG